MTDDDSGALGGAPPRLTIGQRILTALPNLQRRARARGAGADPADRHLTPVDPDGRADTDDDRHRHRRTVTSRRRRSTEVVATRRSGDRRSAHGRGAPADVVAGARRRPVDDLDTMTREEITHRIKKLDDRERFLALTVGADRRRRRDPPHGVHLHLNPAVHSTGSQSRST